MLGSILALIYKMQNDHQTKTCQMDPLIRADKFFGSTRLLSSKMTSNREQLNTKLYLVLV